VPTESKLTSAPDETATAPVSAIENEIATYRAISPMAVFSLILGILAGFSITHWFFLSCAAAAIVLGIVADRKIVRYSDVLTGRKIAQAGIALGLIFGLGVITVTAVQYKLLAWEAGKFARVYEGVLNKGTLEDAIWYGQNPLYRKSKTPQEVATELRKSRHGGAGMFDLEQADLIKLRERLSAGAEVHFSRIEQQGPEQMNVAAAALFEVHLTGSTPLPEGEKYALAIMKGMKQHRRYEWWVDKVVFPYKRASYRPEPKAVDDGHGHAH
jgi:hypothetical protein